MTGSPTGRAANEHALRLVGHALKTASDTWEGGTDEAFWLHLAAAAVEVMPEPELWTAHEVAQFIGRSRQRVDQLADLHPEALTPVLQVSGGRGTRIWTAEAWRRFVASGAWNQVGGRNFRARPRD